MEACVCQQAFTRFIAKTVLKVTAFGATGSGAEAKAFIPADHPVKEFLPLHVLVVAHGQRRKVAHHQRGQLTAIGQSKVLPKMVRPGGPACNQDGKQRTERSGGAAGASQEFPQALLIRIDHRFVIQPEGFEMNESAGKVLIARMPKNLPRDAQGIRERSAGAGLHCAGAKNARQYVAIESVAAGGRVALAEERVYCLWLHEYSLRLARASGSLSDRRGNKQYTRYTRLAR